MILVLVATGLAVAFATRGAMAGNREIVEVLHFVGADDAFIAREFQRRFFRLGLRGGLAGGGARPPPDHALRVPARGPGAASPTGDQIEALFGAFAVGWQGYASVVAVALIASFMTGAVTRITVLRILRRLSGRLARS